ncbi:exonuclease [Arthrobacter alpinus]|uniref:Exonuclease n=1 Tax=Arthrobacter alpinus TaxID=656366 RepID=A0A0M3UG66_9MICC|nr:MULTISPECIES: exonuclease domain-containing protein [Arthrobacter]ALE92555.1 exonuclease [Arthrobacter alpinus]
MPVDFTAIDFETANGFRGSPCSVGLTRVRSGVVVEEGYWLMRPPEGHDHFDSRNITIHGITPDAVVTAPRFRDVFPEVQAFIGADALVAHNAAFDIGVIRSASEVSGMAAPGFDYACTVVLSRKNYSLPSYSLPFVAEAAGVPLLNHHDAVEDARACAGIMVDIAGKHNASSVREVFASMKLAMPHIDSYDPTTDEMSKATRTALEKMAELKAGGGPASGRGGSSGWATEGPNPVPNPAAERSHPLYGQTLVFTGDLGVGRPEAKRRAASYGAQCASNVTLKTTVLVVGSGFTATDLRSGRLTSKAQRVLELQRRGQGIEVLSEGEFMQMVA